MMALVVMTVAKLVGMIVVFTHAGIRREDREARECARSRSRSRGIDNQGGDST